MTLFDHDERRRRIGEVVVDVIARDGLDAATVRRIAAEVGFSTTVITHCFSDKRDLLLSAYHILGEIARVRFEKCFSRDSSDLVSYLMSMSAVDAADLAYWRTFIAIWDRSLRDADFASEVRSWIEEGVMRVQVFIRVLNPGCMDTARIARRLISLVQGISVQLLFDSESWSEDAVRDAIASEVELLVGKQHRSEASVRSASRVFHYEASSRNRSFLLTER